MTNRPAAEWPGGLSRHEPVHMKIGEGTEALRGVECVEFGRIVARQLKLAHGRETLAHGPEQRGADALSLISGKHQKILNEHDGQTVAHGAHNAGERFAVIGGQRQKGAFVCPAQQFRILCIGDPSGAFVERQNLGFAICGVLADSDFQGCGLLCIFSFIIYEECFPGKYCNSVRQAVI